MSYKYTTKTAPAHTKGRGGKKITTIVIHHWGDPATNPTFNSVVNYLSTGKSQTSAHYVVEAGKICQMVDEANTAWHAGNWPVNQCSIGIECNPRCSEGDKQTIAELIKQIQNRWGNLHIIGHKDVKPTACPGKYYPPAPTLAPYLAKTNPSPQTTQNGTDDDIEKLANEVIAGKHGNGQTRRQSLGANYDKVQTRVNQILAGRPAQPDPTTPPTPAPQNDIENLARAVIAGHYGQGQDRINRLGHLYIPVQQRVNEILGAQPQQPPAPPNLEEIAKAVIRGEYGNGTERRNRLGHLYDQVQTIVNRQLGQ